MIWSYYKYRLVRAVAVEKNRLFLIKKLVDISNKVA
jgi:hypothetical protein